MNNEDYLKQGIAKIDDYHTVVNSIVEMMPEPRKSKVKQMLAGPIGEQFMIAPASTRRNFHYAFPCGLVAHSINVVRNATKIAGALWPNRWPMNKITFCALFHDLGKAGGSTNPFYIQTKENWKMARGENYDVNQVDFMPNAERSIFTLLSNGIELDYEEFQAIRLNDGMAPEENKTYSFKETALSLVIHWADHAAMKMEKEEDGK